MKRGDVLWATLSPRSGSEQTGERPVVVVSHDAFNETPSWRSVIVVPVSTSRRQSRRGPTTVHLSKGTAGLTADSLALCHQVTTLDRGKLTRPLGSLPPPDLERIDEALRAALGLGWARPLRKV